MTFRTSLLVMNSPSDFANSILFLALIVFVVFVVLGLCMAFCCYILTRTSESTVEDVEASQKIKYDGLKRGCYKKKWLKKVSLKSDTCAICLDDFRNKEEISLCRCGHAYHHKCIMKWMEIKDTCPICQRHCRQLRKGERTPLLVNPLDI